MALKMFNEFIVSGLVRKQSPDKSRAEFLIKESGLAIEGLKERIAKMEINDKNANSIIKDCYDIIMELIRAKMLLAGYSASGKGAHEAEISYMNLIGFSEKDVRFADQMRYFRNGMIYYGNVLDNEYAKKVVEFTKKIYPQLKRMLLR